MKKLAILLLGAIALTGCATEQATSSPAPAPAAVQTVPVAAPVTEDALPPVEEEVPPSLDDLFLGRVYAEYPELVGADSTAFIALAHATCTALGHGSSRGEVLLALVSGSSKGNEREIGFIAGAGVATYCPKYSRVFGA